MRRRRKKDGTVRWRCTEGDYIVEWDEATFLRWKEDGRREYEEYCAKLMVWEAERNALPSPATPMPKKKED